jgi:hypothetical protein
MWRSDAWMDDRPSEAGLYAEDRGQDVIWVLPVQGLGAIVLRAQEENGALVFRGVSEFTDIQIGHRE